MHYYYFVLIIIMFYIICMLGLSWETDRNGVLPGYREEWLHARPSGGRVVGVTVDNTQHIHLMNVANISIALGQRGIIYYVF